ncbi:unnamed protein product [Protopolystoma xenopodis]|uniref:Uncharacterized protein n=1 Tax=Protopolystoma xenopodis TaxID=117903 RepID=A0A3S5BJ95_9PLAT|nr:unnamed protein product [Protopolystoma xenopodis]
MPQITQNGSSPFLATFAWATRVIVNPFCRSVVGLFVVATANWRLGNCLLSGAIKVEVSSADSSRGEEMSGEDRAGELGADKEFFLSTIALATLAADAWASNIPGSPGRPQL